jgi:hypothetical protein
VERTTLPPRARIPVVAIEISPQGRQPVALAEALVEACSSAVREGECALASDDASQAKAVAVVKWSDDAELGVIVRVEVRHGSETDVRMRSLDFAPGDLRVERWRSVGLTIATLVGGKAQRNQVQPVERTPRRAAPTKTRTPKRRGATAAPAEEAPAAEAAEPSDREPESPASAGSTLGRRSQRLWTSLAAFAGPGLDPGGPRVGARFQVGWRPSSLALFLSPDVSFALASENERGVSGRWWSGGLSLGWVVPLGSLVDLEPRLGVRVERSRPLPRSRPGR